LERGVRPIGDWSMSMILSICSSPSMRSCGAAPSLALLSLRATALYSVSINSVDLPPPETPVTQVNSPSGISAEIFLRLLPRALITLMVRRWFGGLRSGISTDSSPVRYFPVSESGLFMMSAGCPGRPYGRHACRRRADVEDMIGLPDGVLVVLDYDHGIAEVAQPLQGSNSRALSRWCRPIEGSSST